jgi:arsenite oxidase small subunit
VRRHRLAGPQRARLLLGVVADREYKIELGTGVGPDGDIVGFSTVCPHKGFPLAYTAGDRTLNCPGHYSRFDCELGGQQIWGQATQNLPQYVLRIGSGGDIYAEGIDELLYGRLSNVL